MTTQECECRDKRVLDRIRTVLDAHNELKHYAHVIAISIDDTSVTLQGRLPAKMRDALEPAVRRAGVLSKINNFVEVLA
jgi:hypothetical protein